MYSIRSVNIIFLQIINIWSKYFGKGKSMSDSVLTICFSYWVHGDWNKDFRIGIQRNFFSIKHITLKRKNILYYLSWNQSNMYTCGFSELAGLLKFTHVKGYLVHFVPPNFNILVSVVKDIYWKMFKKYHLLILSF